MDEVKFPLGIWKENETRVFAVSCNNGAMRRKIELTIEKLDFDFEGVPHSLQFHWVVDGGKGKGTDMHYIYSPGRGLASLDEEYSTVLAQMENHNESGGRNSGHREENSN